MRHRHRVWIGLLVAAGVLSVTRPGAAEPAEKSFEWETATPESQGMSLTKLDALRDGIAKTTKALFVVRNDRVVYEWYAEGHGPTKCI